MLQHVGLPIGNVGRGFRMPQDGLVASYVAEMGVTTVNGKASNWADLSGLGSRDFAQATAANRLTYFPYDGQKYIYHPGVAGNYLSTPNAAANQITGDLDIKWWGTLDSLAPAAYGVLDSNTAAGASGWMFAQDTASSGKLFAQVYLAGPTAVTYLSTVTLASVGLSAGAFCGLRITRNATTGAVNFYYDPDGVSGWTLLGTSVAGTAGAMITPTAAHLIGDDATGLPLAGKTFALELWNGIEGAGGSLAQRFDASDGIDGDTSIVSSDTGETWTVNQVLPGVPCYLVGMAGLCADGVAGFMKTPNFGLAQPTEIYLVGKQLSWTVGDHIMDGTSTNVGALFQNNASPQMNLYAGAGAAANTDLAVGARGVISLGFNGASSFLQVNKNAATTGDPGAGNMGGLTIGSVGSGTSYYGNFMFNEIHAYNAASSAAERLRRIEGLMNRRMVV